MGTRAAVAVTFWCCLALGGRADASDGAIEINQAKALAGSVTPGDAPGFPVTLSQTGSYILTSNLTVPSGVSGIVVSTISPGLVLDLGGFEIAGAGSCTGVGASVTCSGGGFGGNGVEASVPIRLRNGRVRGFGVNGIALLQDRNQVEFLRVEQNGGEGATLGSSSIVTDSIFSQNGAGGILLSGTSIVERCVTRWNRQAGFRSLGAGNSFLGNAASGNGQQGIDARANAVVRNNSVVGNTADGIVVHAGSLVSDNTSSLNGAAGIAALSSSAVQRNIVRGNVGIGLYLFPEFGGTAAAYVDNMVVGNTGGTVVNGINMGGNSCNGTTTCP